MTFYNLNEFEQSLFHFKTRVELIVSLELGGKIDEHEAYRRIKQLAKELKKSKKQTKNNDGEIPESNETN